MRDCAAPFLLRFFLVASIIDYGGGEGAGDGEEDEPVAGRKSGS